MEGNKFFIVLVLGVVLVVVVDSVTKSMDKGRVIGLMAQEEANQTLIQQQKLSQSADAEGSDSGAIGGLLQKLPLIGGLF
jgi:hypothetical protein